MSKTPNGGTVASDVAEINDTSVTSNISIIQGTGTSTAANAGLYVAAIGFDYLGLISGDQASGSVTVGGDTYIYQNYANNQVFLGDTGTGSIGFRPRSSMPTPAPVVAPMSRFRTPSLSTVPSASSAPTTSTAAAKLPPRLTVRAASPSRSTP